MTVPVGKLKGMTANVQLELKACAVYDSSQLLAAVRTPADREGLARQIGVESATLLKLANRADLGRVRGIGMIFADLLEEAGVDTVRELAVRNPTNLHAALVQANSRLQLARRAPSPDMVRSWVVQAKRLSPALEY
jgi:predicted flap endonuclease-1-like 5' DNA nuclease